ncbi:hypothetical protein ACQKP0_19965 [Heyndrickxia sp. NPDC080065]|uniref:hypothetical protein n=1 Tax=Heyndrickxia sp. NPDC080065 TaxID=3390568 RepID=UPI003D0885EA
MPTDSWAYARNERNDGEFETELVVLFEGNTQLEKLNLDKPFKEENVFLVLVDGNLIVENYIYNDETDGATGLIVKGNLQTRNMVVGGQEIYVTGNLHVTELIWGDYNHGDLTVAGNASALLFMDTDEYYVSIKGEQQFILRISNWDEFGNWDDLDDELLQEVFVQECLLKLDEKLYFNRGRMLDYFEIRHSVIIPDKVKRVEEVDIPFLFENADISIGNLLRLADSNLMPYEAGENKSLKYEFWLEDEFFRVIRAARPSEYRAVYFQQDQCAMIVELIENKQEDNLLKKLVRRTEKPSMILNYRWRYIEGKDTEWYTLDVRSPEQFHHLLKNGWRTLLTNVSRFEYYRRSISPEQIRDLLSLPVAEPYDDFYGEEKGGFWSGNMFTAFRQPGVVRNGEEKSPCFVVAREIGDEMEIYHFSVEKCMDGNDVVNILYQAENGYEHSAFSVWDEERLKIACRLFRNAERRLLSLNRNLLAGEVPYDAEAFAIEHWKRKGYISFTIDNEHCDL